MVLLGLARIPRVAASQRNQQQHANPYRHSRDIRHDLRQSPFHCGTIDGERRDYGNAVTFGGDSRPDQGLALPGGLVCVMLCAFDNGGPTSTPLALPDAHGRLAG